MTQLIRILAITCLLLPGLSPLSHATGQATPPPPGKMVDLGGHHLHVHCTGHGSPPVLVETGLGDFSFDWTLVQSQVARFTRICTYDRAGYAWSDPGPLPRSFAQINLELHDALQQLGEKGPFVLVGHSYGGTVVRNYASVYPDEVAGIVLVDAAHEGLRVQVGPKQTIRLGADVQQQPIPSSHEELQPSDKPTDPPSAPPQPIPLEPIYKSLPLAQQKLHLWAASLPGVNAAEDSQRQWSDQSFARWLANPADASLGHIPLIVLSRSDGGYTEDSDVPASQMERERKDGQDRLAKLSSNSLHILVESGHNMHLEAPGQVSAAIRRMVTTLRAGKTLAATP